MVAGGTGCWGEQRLNWVSFHLWAGACWLPRIITKQKLGFPLHYEGYFIFFLSVPELYGDFAYSRAKLVNRGGIDGC